MTNLLSLVMAALDRGWSVVPVKCQYDGEKVKKPATVKWLKYRDQRVEKSVVLTQWKNKLQDDKGFGYAVICGEISNLFVVDVDTEEANQKVLELMGGFQTYTVKTPGGGYHYYFLHTDGFNNGASIGISGLDIRTYGGYVVGPGSTYPNGVPYVVEHGAKVGLIPQKLKQYILDRVEEKKKPGRPSRQRKNNNDWYTDILASGFTEGQRVDQLKRVVGLLVGKGETEEHVRQMVRIINTCSQEPLSDAELHEQTTSMLKRFTTNEKRTSGELEERILDLNERYAQITLGGKPMIMRFKAGSCSEYDLIQPAAMRTEIKHKIEWIGKTKTYLSFLWGESEKRRRYQEIVFEPSWEPQKDYIDGDNGRYNTWRGFAYEPKEGDWSLFHRHLTEIMAPGHGDYLLKWLARIFQDPGGKRPGKVIVFRGKQGVGKSLPVNMIGKFFGSHYYKTDNIEHLIGRFNTAVADKILLMLEEAMWAGDRRLVGKFKERITGETMSIEKKGVDVIEVASHLNIMMSSNESWVVPIQDEDRRFVVFDVLENHAKDRSYFQAMIDQMENGGYEAMLYDMLNTITYTMDELNDSPKTEAAFEQSTFDNNSVKQFALNCLERGVLHPSHKGWKNVIIKSKLYESYEMFCTAQRLTYKETFYHFKNSIAKYLPIVETDRRRWGERVNGVQKGRKIVPIFVIMDLIKSKEFFSKGYEVTWGEPEIEDSLTDEERQKDLIDEYQSHYCDAF